MKHYFCKAGTLFFLAVLALSGCAANAVPSQYDLKLKTKVESLEFEVGGEIAQVEITIDSRRYQELSSEQNIYLSYHILSDKKENIIYDGIRTPLESIDARGIEKEIVDVQAPLEAGEYIVEIDLVEEGVTWFSAQGMPTLQIPMTVRKSIVKDISMRCSVQLSLMLGSFHNIALKSPLIFKMIP